MKRLISRNRLGRWPQYGLFLMILLAAVAIWQGCSDDPVTPRKSIIGYWELITLKIDGEVVDFDYDELLVFDDVGLSYEAFFQNDDLLYSYQFDNWGVGGDSLYLDYEGQIRTVWYSCTDDRLTLRGYIEEMDETGEWIYARLEVH